MVRVVLLGRRQDRDSRGEHVDVQRGEHGTHDHEDG
jgi:hypothetical protein